jgi:peroxiredoxin
MKILLTLWITCFGLMPVAAQTLSRYHRHQSDILRGLNPNSPLYALKASKPRQAKMQGLIWFKNEQQARLSIEVPRPEDPYWQQCLVWSEPLPDTSLRPAEIWWDKSQAERYQLLKDAQTRLYQTQSLPSYHIVKALEEKASWANQATEAYLLENHQGDTLKAWLSKNRDLPSLTDFSLEQAEYAILAWTNQWGDSAYITQIQSFEWPQDWIFPKPDELLPASVEDEQTNIQAKKSRVIKLDKDLANFKFEGLDGRSYTNKDLKGKKVVLNFWFIACPPCRAEMPSLNALKAKYPHWLFLAPTFEKSTAVRVFLSRQNFEFTILLTHKHWLQQQGIHTYPRHLILDEKGKVRYDSQVAGSHSVEKLEQAMQRLDKGQP